MAVNSSGQTLTGNTAAADAPRMKVGRVVYDATAITTTDYSVFSVGFTPKYIKFTNLTDRVSLEWFEGMAANSALKTAAGGTQTLEVTGGNGGLTICDSDSTANSLGRYFAVLQNSTLGAILASKTCTWIAHG